MMTNINPVIKALSALLKMDEEETIKYSSIAENAVTSIEQRLKNSESIADQRIVYLCAVKAYLHIILTEKDDICSFSAGDISYAKGSASVENAEKLLKDAVIDCSDLLNSTEFTFKAV